MPLDKTVGPDLDKCKNNYQSSAALEIVRRGISTDFQNCCLFFVMQF